MAFWQFFIGFPLLLPMAPASNLPVSEIGQNLWWGLRCYVGINSQAGDNCALAPLFTNLYILFNLVRRRMNEARGGRLRFIALNVICALSYQPFPFLRSPVSALVSHHHQGYNVLIILMLKYGSSNILWLCLTMQVPVSRVSRVLWYN